MNLQAVLFDLDGVIVDTARFHYQAWKRLADTLEIPFTEKQNERLKGVSRMESLSILLSLSPKPLHYSPDEIEDLAAKKNSWYGDYINTLTEADILPGFREFMAWCVKNSLKTAIVSASKNTGTIVDRLGIRSLFSTIVDGTRVRNAKPDTEVFLLAAEDLSVHPGHCLVVEDAGAGIRGALAAGMLTLGVGDPAVLEGAAIVVPSLDRLDTRLLEAL